ncbi:Stress-induced-phosphoprotein 1 [Araneus ventricosus]|uniref:Stress-induced-phosphoprotein 1 n=1 Tax=Araneus ventricosus TaxID=182803 RepID=A0A4Y2GD72_ARAVE|nr:Stress-induced-phosphoprotein 1 [Araneus ventricosus]
MSDKEKATLLKDQGNAALNAGKFDEAIRFYSEAVKVDPTNHVLYSNRSAAYCKAAKYEDALKDAEKTIELKPDFVKGYSRKGAALAYLKKYPEALTAYNEGLKQDPNNDQLKEGIREVKAQASEMANNAGFPNPFKGPEVLEKLRNDPRTRDFFSDPSYIKLLTDLQSNPTLMVEKLKDPRVMTTLSVLLNIDLSNANMQDDDVDMETPPPPSSKPESSKPKEEPMDVELTPEKKQVFDFNF